MIISRRVAGKHFEFICSKCHKTIDRYMFDNNCPHCKEKIKADEGDRAVCLGAIIYGCMSNCRHRCPHNKRTSDCRMSYCNVVGHTVSCVIQ